MNSGNLHIPAYRSAGPARAASLLAAAVLLLLAGGCGERVPDGVDLSTPQGAARGFFDSLAAGDADAAAACVVREDVQRNLAWRLADLVRAGVAADDLTTLPSVAEGRLEEARVAVDGDEARLTLPASAAAGHAEGMRRPEAAGELGEFEQRAGAGAVERTDVVVLRRSGRLWRVDLLATMGMSEQEAGQYAQRLAAAAATFGQGGP